MKISGIYQIQSKLKPDRFYIGSGVNIENRWANHLSFLKNNKHFSIKLQRHFNKYGERDLIFIIIEFCFPEFLTAREQYYINKLKPYFNNCLIAGSRLGFKCSKETKSLISLALIGNKHAKNSKARTGQEITEENRINLIKSHRGQKPWNKGKKGLQVAWNKGLKGLKRNRTKKLVI